MADDIYNIVPAGNGQYAQCLRYSGSHYEGGDAQSPRRWQSKAEAWCTCMWNETPGDFRGNLTKFSETANGKSTNRTCEKYVDWG
jgi:hypothetical protein